MDLLSLFALWTSKAFDKSGSLYTLVKLLMDRRLPRNFVAILQNCLDIMLCLCSLGIEALIILVWYCVIAGVHSVRQEGVLFAIYMDVLIVRLRSSGFGCCVFVVYFGCLMFADDTLLTHSVLSRL